MTSPSQVQYGSFAFIPDAEGRLLARDGRLLLVPRLERHLWQDVADLNATTRALTGLTLTTLRCLALDYLPGEDGSGVYLSAYAMENHAPDAQPHGDGWAWLTAADAQNLAEGERELAEIWFAWRGGLAARPPLALWYAPGWYRWATSWAAEQVGGQVRLEQLRTWGRSAILRAEADAGTLYLKAVPPVFGHEPALTAWLAGKFPANAPSLIAADVGRFGGVMLMRPFPGPALTPQAVAPPGPELRQFAAIQAEAAAHTAELLALGVPDRRAFIDDAIALLTDDEALGKGQIGGLKDAEIALLRANIDHFRALCRELYAVGVPFALEHGDFYPSQIVHDAPNSQYIYFDWSDASIAHPFFSLASYLQFLDDERPDLPADARRAFAETYLRAWGEHTGIPEQALWRAAGLARALAPLHFAALYYRHILPGLEFRWEMERMVGYYLREALRHLRDSPSQAHHAANAP